MDGSSQKGLTTKGGDSHEDRRDRAGSTAALDCEDEVAGLHGGCIGGTPPVHLTVQFIIELPSLVCANKMDRSNFRAREDSRVPNPTTKLETRTQNLIKALSFPLRAEIHRILSERVASPNEISKELGEHVTTISHHVRVLAELDCIEEVRQEPRRGAIEHFYKATVKPWVDTEDWDKMPLNVRKSFLGEAVDLFLRDCIAGIASGTLGDHSNIVLARDRTELDEQGLTEAREIADEAFKAIEEVAEKSANRLAESGEPGMTVPIMVACFPLPDA